ncbi:MAG: YihY/virulence factor BrkB family protein [Lentisphaeria bacterium]|nr:YihY/virulence factor BrkB family protein [Lentisphaeria bacterium]
MAKSLLNKILEWNLIKEARDFLSVRIWDADFQTLRFLKRSGYSLCRMLEVAICGFVEDRCTLQSSALTYITMVSLVPILAITLAFCKGIGLQRQLLGHLGIDTMLQVMPDHSGPPQLTYVIVKKEPKKSEKAAEKDSGQSPGTPLESHSVPERYSASTVKPGFAAELPEPMQVAVLNLIGYVDHTNFAALGVVGVLTLLTTVVMSIKKLENNFNTIWCVSRGRSLLRQISEYLVVLLLAPVMLFLVLSLTAFISSDSLAQFLHTSSEQVIFWGRILSQLVLLVCLIASFMALYLFMPNTHVRLGPALLAGTVAAILWGIVLLMYVKWQIGLAKYNAIYGTFAALPFFLAWLYASWLVILLGAEICFAAQNQRLLRQTKQLLPLEAGANRILGIAIVEAISKCFDEGKGCWNAVDFAMEHNVSIRELEFSLKSLLTAKLVIQRKPEADPPECYEYMLGRPASQITLSQVSEAFIGIESENALRMEKCLPPKFVAFLKKRHQETVSKLGQLTFEHSTPEDEVLRPTVENPDR